MEGSARKANQSDPKIAARRRRPAGESGRRLARRRTPRFTGNFKRDAAAGTKFWRKGADLLAALPEKPKRKPAQQAAPPNDPVRWPRRRAKRFCSGTPRRSIAS